MAGRLYFTTGCMRSGKSLMLLHDYHAEIDKDAVIVFMPVLTKNRQQDSTLFKKVPVKYISSLSNVLDHVNEKTKTVYIDEVNLFASGSGITAISDLLHSGYKVKAYGLRRDRDDMSYSKLTRWLLLFADEINVMHGARCDAPGCLEEGYNSMIEVGDTGEKNVVDSGDVVYKVYCEDHYILRLYNGGKAYE